MARALARPLFETFLTTVRAAAVAAVVALAFREGTPPAFARGPRISVSAEICAPAGSAGCLSLRLGSAGAQRAGVQFRFAPARLGQFD